MTLGASRHLLGNRTGADDTGTLAKKLSWLQPMAPWTTGLVAQQSLGPGPANRSWPCTHLSTDIGKILYSHIMGILLSAPVVSE